MDAPAFRWKDLPEDRPIDRLSRRRITGEQMLLARVFLEAGCYVAPHRHASEQIAIVLSGRVRWIVGEGPDRREFEMGGGEVLLLPSNVMHGLNALEDTEILDVLSPPGPMGVDAAAAAAVARE